MLIPSMRSVLMVNFFFVATTCSAGTYIDNTPSTLNSATNNAGIYVNIHNGDPLVNINYGYSGFINWKQNGNANAFTTFCIELNQDVSFGGSYSFTRINLENAPNPGPPSPMGIAKANAIRALWAQNFASLTTGTATVNLEKAAAFQLAIWRIEYDGAGSLNLLTVTNFGNSGNFQANSSSTNSNGPSSTNAIAYAVNMLNNLNLSGPKANDLWALSGGGFQDQITQIDGVNSIQDTPEPSSLCLGVVGGIGLAVVGYRRRRTTLQVA